MESSRNQDSYQSFFLLSAWDPALTLDCDLEMQTELDYKLNMIDITDRRGLLFAGFTY